MLAAAPRRIENAVTGDRIEFLNSPLHGDPGPLIFRCVLPPGATGSPLHAHQALAERFETVSGELVMDFPGRSVRRLGAGQRLDIPAGEFHGFRNPGSHTVEFQSMIEPGENFEKFLRVMYGLANDGRTDSKGSPSDLRSLALALGYADIVLPVIPLWVQRPILRALSGMARNVGLDDDMGRYFDAAPVAQAAA
jgi:mannose-6-phosphate isomerase-like protein (cupin superfamily)